jgi:hypothetical protein
MKNKSTSMTVQEASRLMGKSQDFIRIGLQRSILPFGYAVKTGKERYSYFISREKFIATTGIKC